MEIKKKFVIGSRESALAVVQSRMVLAYLKAHCPELDREEQSARCLAHLQQKYAEGGYLRLWIAESENARRLEELRGVIRDPQRLRKMFDAAFDTETAE